MINLIKSIYTKEPVVIEKLDLGMMIGVTNMLRYDISNIKVLKNMIDMLYYLEPKHYLTLLILLIPKKEQVPWLKKVTLQTTEFDSLLGKIQYVLGWTNRELEIHRPYLQTIDREYWSKQLGVK